jgi:hypothetical protein
MSDLPEQAKSLAQYGAGILGGVASSLTNGLIAAPKSTDSEIYRAGEIVGTAGVGADGIVTMEAGITAAGGGLVAAPVTGGSSLAVSGAGVVTAAAGGWMTYGSVSNMNRIAQTPTEGGESSNGGKSNKQLRSDWEKKEGKTWPKDEATGKNQDVHHKKAVADGGARTLENIEPKPRADHVNHHKANGDFKRWGSRAKKKTEGN